MSNKTFAKTFVIHKDEDRWAFEEVVDGKVVKHFYTAKRKAINAVLIRNPGTGTIIMSFQEAKP